MRLYLLTLLSATTVWAAPPAFDFTASASAQGWSAAHELGEIRPSAEGLVLTATGNDPFLVGPVGDYRAEQPLIFTLRLRSPEAGMGQVFFYEKGASEDRSLHFRVSAGWNDLAIPLPPLANGTRLRLDLPARPGEYVLAKVASEETGRGITGVTATKDELRLQLIGTQGQVEILELLPHEDPTVLRSDRVVWTGPTPAGGKFEVKIPRRSDQRDRAYHSFFVRSAPMKLPIGVPHFAEGLEKLAPDQRPFPVAASKKGLQFQELPDALELGIKHGTINVSMGALLDLQQKPGNPTWTVDGQTYAFNRGYLDSFPVKTLTQAGVTAYIILLGSDTGKPDVNQVVQHPNHHRPLPNHIAAFNTATEEGTRALRATCEFLAHWYSQPNDPNGRLAGIIVGNEVNAHWQWYNFGTLPAALAVQEYAKALRIANTAVRQSSAQLRIYSSFTHHWAAKPGPKELGAKFFLEHLTRLSRTTGDYDWHIAFHPYPQNLFEPRFWKDSHATRDPGTPHITFRNLDLLTTWLGTPDHTYQGAPRRVILSEQGFHSDNTPDGDQAQAAAYCLAWEKVARLPGIDAFILHRHVDHKGEGGLNLGLWKRQPNSVLTPETKRLMYDCFKAAGTSAQEEVFRFALPVIGIKSWDEANPPRQP